MENFWNKYFSNNKKYFLIGAEFCSMLFFRNNNEIFPDMDLIDIFGIISATTRKFFQIIVNLGIIVKFSWNYPLLPVLGLEVACHTRISEGRGFESRLEVLLEKRIM